MYRVLIKTENGNKTAINCTLARSITRNSYKNIDNPHIEFTYINEYGNSANYTYLCSDPDNLVERLVEVGYLDLTKDNSEGIKKSSSFKEPKLPYVDLSGPFVDIY